MSAPKFYYGYVTLNNCKEVPLQSITPAVLTQIKNGDAASNDPEAPYIYYPVWVDPNVDDDVVVAVNDGDIIPDLTHVGRKRDDGTYILPWLDFSQFTFPFKGISLVGLWSKKGNSRVLQEWAAEMLAIVTPQQRVNEATQLVQEEPQSAFNADPNEISINGIDMEKLIQNRTELIEKFVRSHGMLMLMTLMYSRSSARTPRVDKKIDAIATSVKSTPTDSANEDYDELTRSVTSDFLTKYCLRVRETTLTGIRATSTTGFLDHTVTIAEGSALGKINGLERSWTIDGAFVRDSRVKITDPKKSPPGFLKVGNISVSAAEQKSAWVALLRQFGNNVESYQREIPRYSWVQGKSVVENFTMKLVDAYGKVYTPDTLDINPFVLYDPSITEQTRICEITKALLSAGCKTETIMRLESGEGQNSLKYNQYPVTFLLSLCSPMGSLKEGRLVIDDGGEIAALENARAIRKDTIYDTTYFKTGYAMIDYGTVEGVQELEHYNAEVVRMLHIADDIVKSKCSDYSGPKLNWKKYDYKVVICTKINADVWTSLTPKLDKIFGNIRWYIQPLEIIPLAFTTGDNAKHIMKIGELIKMDQPDVIYVRLDNCAGENDYHVVAPAKGTKTVINELWGNYSACFARVYQLVSFSAKREVNVRKDTFRILKSDVPAPNLVANVRKGVTTQLTVNSWNDVYGQQDIIGVGTVPVGHNSHTAQRIAIFDLVGDGPIVQVTIGYTAGSILSAARWGVYETLACSVNRFNPKLLYVSPAIQKHCLKACRITVDEHSLLHSATSSAEY